MERTRQLPLFGDGEQGMPSHEQPRAAAGTAVPETPSLLNTRTYVVDAFALLFQIFHAMPEMTSPQGQSVGCVYGFLRDMLFLIDEKKPDYLFVAFDVPGGTFRHELYEHYKADRGEMPESLLEQIPNVKRMLAALHVPVLSLETFEADDVIATVARRVEQAGGECFIVSNDKDCRQLISDRVRIFSIRKNEVFDRDALEREWGIRPDQVVDFQALVGDPVDHVPGVPLVGPKIAGQWLRLFDSL
jgi:DNA polymerase-1